MNARGQTLLDQDRTRPAHTRVVVGVDGTAANWSAVTWAVAEARRGHRPLLLLACGSADTPPSAPRSANLEREHLERLTRDLLDEVHTRVEGLVEDVSTRAAVGEPSHALVRAADEGDLLVVGKRGGHPLSRTVLGSTSIAVTGRSRGPVVVVPERWTGTEHQAGPIVAGVDGDRDPQVLDFAFDRAERLGLPLVVVNAWDLPAPQTRSSDDVQRWSDEAQRHLDEVVAPWRRRHPDVTLTTSSHVVTPTVALLGDGTRAQLLVLGRHTGPQHPGGLSMGSTVRKVLHHAACPVAVVPPPAARRAGAVLDDAGRAEV
jgi:nucleotide-binding universal stress UspA family protein